MNNLTLKKIYRTLLQSNLMYKLHGSVGNKFQAYEVDINLDEGTETETLIDIFEIDPLGGVEQTWDVGNNMFAKAMNLTPDINSRDEL